MLGEGRPTEAKLPQDARIAFVSTRRAQPAADTIAGHLLARYTLHDMMAAVTAPLHELIDAHLVVLEIPPIVTARFEHDLLLQDTCSSSSCAGSCST